MRFIIGGAAPLENRFLCRATEEYFAGRKLSVELRTLRSFRETKEAGFRPAEANAAVIGFGSVEGFLCARRIREANPSCAIILIDDTDEYAIRSMRLHVADFLLRPVTAERYRKALDRIMGIR